MASPARPSTFCHTAHTRWPPLPSSRPPSLSAVSVAVHATMAATAEYTARGM